MVCMPLRKALMSLLMSLLTTTTAAHAAPTSTLPTAQTLPKPPVAATVHHTVKSPQGERVDEYHWLRDDDPKAKRPDILQHLQAENAYTAALLAPLQPLQARIDAELRARVAPDDSTAPLYDSGFWLWREYKPGAEYPLLMRQRGSPDRPDPKAPRQLMLDQNARAAGQPY